MNDFYLFREKYYKIYLFRVPCLKGDNETFRGNLDIHYYIKNILLSRYLVEIAVQTMYLCISVGKREISRFFSVSILSILEGEQFVLIIILV